MNYIKLFENSENKHISFYKNIRYDLKTSLIYYYNISSETNNAKLIPYDGELIKMIGTISNMKYFIINTFDKKEVNCSRSQYNTEFRFHLYKDNDDYFYLVVNNSGYRCDGLDNLSTLIKTMLEILDSNMTLFRLINRELNI